jgi:predicted Zn-dependent protease
MLNQHLDGRLLKAAAAAGVMAHELSHVMQRHGTAGATKGRVSGVPEIIPVVAQSIRLSD